MKGSNHQQRCDTERIQNHPHSGGAPPESRGTALELADQLCANHWIASRSAHLYLWLQTPSMHPRDSGSELTGRALEAWAIQHGVLLCFIRPGRPVGNGLDRKLQRSTARRVPARRVVRISSPCTRKTGAMAKPLQPATPTQCVGRSNAGFIRRRPRSISSVLHPDRTKYGKQCGHYRKRTSWNISENYRRLSYSGRLHLCNQ